MKLSSTADTTKEWDAIQGTWTNLRTRPTEFNKSKCKGLHLGWGDELIENSPAEKDLGVFIDKKLDINQQGVLAAQKPIMGCYKMGLASSRREVILPLCSALTRPCLEYRIHSDRSNKV